LVFLAILVWIRFLNENFTDPPVFLNFVRRASPLMILAVGQLFVVAAGGFDLSVGSIVTATAVVAARYSDGDPANTWWLIILIVIGGALIGVVNGLVVTKLKVPSFIATLAMLLILDGAVRYWTGGAPRGALADNIRTFGRGGWEGVPWAETVPFAAVIMLAFAIGGSMLLSRTDFGHQVLAVGGGPTTSALSGVHVHAVRIGTFVISGVCAAIAGILQSGITGVSDKVGAGLEFRAISAVVLGGAVLGGGKGVVSAAVIGALTLESIFTLLNLLRFSEGMRDTVQGVVIILAVALATLRERTRRASQTIAAATVAVESPSPSIRGSTA
jgi:ribose transport system permease protein